MDIWYVESLTSQDTWKNPQWKKKRENFPNIKFKNGAPNKTFGEEESFIANKSK